ncbi:hypothetical protein JCM10207_008059 [Rhodosporidiobolus poonsookiae]
MQPAVHDPGRYQAYHGGVDGPLAHPDALPAPGSSLFTSAPLDPHPSLPYPPPNAPPYVDAAPYSAGPPPQQPLPSLKQPLRPAFSMYDQLTPAQSDDGNESQYWGDVVPASHPYVGVQAPGYRWTGEAWEAAHPPYEAAAYRPQEQAHFPPPAHHHPAYPPYPSPTSAVAPLPYSHAPHAPQPPGLQHQRAPPGEIGDLYRPPSPHSLHVPVVPPVSYGQDGNYPSAHYAPHPHPPIHSRPPYRHHYSSSLPDLDRMALSGPPAPIAPLHPPSDLARIPLTSQISDVAIGQPPSGFPSSDSASHYGHAHPAPESATYLPHPHPHPPAPTRKGKERAFPSPAAPDSPFIDAQLPTPSPSTSAAASAPPASIVDANGRRRKLPKDAASRKYVCTECDQRFARPSALATHVLTHTKEKPFICFTCERGFAVMSNLRRHCRVRNHTLQPSQEAATRARSSPASIPAQSTSQPSGMASAPAALAGWGERSSIDSNASSSSDGGMFAVSTPATTAPSSRNDSGSASGSRSGSGSGSRGRSGASSHDSTPGVLQTFSLPATRGSVTSGR